MIYSEYQLLVPSCSYAIKLFCAFGTDMTGFLLTFVFNTSISIIYMIIVILYILLFMFMSYSTIPSLLLS